jgi:rubrerythrin
LVHLEPTGKTTKVDNQRTRKEKTMPEFSNPFTVLKNERKLTREELVRAVRFMIAAEYEAIQLYQQTAESTDNPLARDVLLDIANEEKEHAGEFLRLLRELEPEEEKFYRTGYEEVEEIIEKLGKRTSRPRRR